MKRNILLGIAVYIQGMFVLCAQADRTSGKISLTIEENETPLYEIKLKAIVPDTVVQGELFYYYYELSGIIKNINEISYTSNRVEGLDSLRAPIRRFLDMHSFFSEEDQKEYTRMEYALINVSRSTKTGEIILPPLKVIADKREYLSEPAKIQVIPGNQTPKVEATIGQKAPEKAIIDKEFQLEITVETYSGYFDTMQTNISDFEEALSSDFIIVKKHISPDKRSFSPSRQATASVDGQTTFRWYLKPLATGTVVLPQLTFTLENETYKSGPDRILVLSAPDKEDAEIYYNPVAIVGTPVAIEIGLKDEDWEFYSEEFPDPVPYGFSPFVPDEEQILRASHKSGQYYITPQRTGELVIPPVLIKTDKGEFYTDSIRMTVLPGNTENR